MTEHIYMSNYYTAKNIPVSFEFPKYMMQDVIDYFRSNLKIEETGQVFRATVKVNDRDFRFWSRRYFESVKILSPESLIKKEKMFIKSVLNEYD